MFLSEWREFPSEPCLAEKKIDDSSRLDVVEIARVADMLPGLFSFLVGPRTYQHPGKHLQCNWRKEIIILVLHNLIVQQYNETGNVRIT